MSKSLLLAEIILLTSLLGLCHAGRTHYYEGSGYPSAIGYNRYNSPYGNSYGYGGNGYDVNSYGVNGYPDYRDYYDYDDEDYDGYGGSGGYGNPYGSYGGNGYPLGGSGYPYGYQQQILPTKFVSSPVVKEYVAPLPPVSKSITTSSLYQTHPSGYGNHGYAGGYGYAPKYGSVYGSGYYRK